MHGYWPLLATIALFERRRFSRLLAPCTLACFAGFFLHRPEQMPRRTCRGPQVVLSDVILQTDECFATVRSPKRRDRRWTQLWRTTAAVAVGRWKQRPGRWRESSRVGMRRSSVHGEWSRCTLSLCSHIGLSERQTEEHGLSEPKDCSTEGNSLQPPKGWYIYDEGN